MESNQSNLIIFHI